MVRILAVGGKSLLRSLNGRFGAGIEVLGTDSVDQAVVQALVERPDLIVCADADLDGPVEEFWGDLQKVGLERTPLLCVGEAPVRASEASRDGFAFCTEETLLEAVAELLPDPGESGARRNVQLLASLTRVPWVSEDGGQELANVLELGPSSLLVESPILLERGQRLALSFFLPPARAGTAQQVSLACVVTAPRDEEALQYEADIDFMDDAATAALAGFLSQPETDL